MIEKIILAILSCIISGLYGYLISSFKRIKEESEAEKEGLKSLLRANMVKTYYQYRGERHIPYYEKENWHSEYESYKRLGGNSFIEDIKNEIDTWIIVD